MCIVLDGEMLSFPPENGNKAWMPGKITFLQSKMNKDTKTGKEEIILSLFVENNTMYIENSKIIDLSDLINEFSSVFGYKTKLQI